MANSETGLIETDALEKLLSSENVKILDASYHVPPSPRNASEEFQAQHIPAAQFFDIDSISDPSSPYPHMLPSAQDFEKAVGALGISNQDYIVVYDVHGIMSAPQAWWMFRYFGHNNISVLNGGLPKWLLENRTVETGKQIAQSATFTANPRPELLISLDNVQANLGKQEFQLVDYRTAPRFLGETPEPREGLHMGHIPGSFNIPWASLMDPERKTLSPKEALITRFKQSGVDVSRHMACSCGSGVTACVGALALYTLGYNAVPVYDGSWAEWGSRNDVPVEGPQTVT